MKKTLVTAAAALIMSASLSAAAFAGQWTGAGNGVRKYQKDDGSYAIGWNWIDSNADGRCECYFFDAHGNLVVNSVIDGYRLNADGAWVNRGSVVTSDQIATTPTYSSDLSLIQGTWNYVQISSNGRTYNLNSIGRKTTMVVSGSTCTLTANTRTVNPTLFNITDYAKSYYASSGVDTSMVTAIYTDGTSEFRLLKNGTMTLTDKKTGHIYTMERSR